MAGNAAVLSVCPYRAAVSWTYIATELGMAFAMAMTIKIFLLLCLQDGFQIQLHGAIWYVQRWKSS
jgi:hypothetical protein